MGNDLDLCSRSYYWTNSALEEFFDFTPFGFLRTHSNRAGIFLVFVLLNCIRKIVFGDQLHLLEAFGLIEVSWTDASEEHLRWQCCECLQMRIENEFVSPYRVLYGMNLGNFD